MTLRRSKQVVKQAVEFSKHNGDASVPSSYDQIAEKVASFSQVTMFNEIKH